MEFHSQYHERQIMCLHLLSEVWILKKKNHCETETNSSENNCKLLLDDKNCDKEQASNEQKCIVIWIIILLEWWSIAQWLGHLAHQPISWLRTTNPFYYFAQFLTLFPSIHSRYWKVILSFGFNLWWYRFWKWGKGPKVVLFSPSDAAKTTLGHWVRDCSNKKEFFSSQNTLMIMKMMISSRVRVLLTFSTTSSITYVNWDTNPI